MPTPGAPKGTPWSPRSRSAVSRPNVASQIRGLNFTAPLREIASLPDDWRADEVKKVRPGDTGPLHYSNTPNDQATFDRARDCKDDQCVVAAIEKYSAVLKDKAQARDKRREALIYLVHFMGDLHQPMHAAGGQVRDETTGNMVPDRGGNSSRSLLGVETNLTAPGTASSSMGPVLRRRLRSYCFRRRCAAARSRSCSAARSWTGSTSATTPPSTIPRHRHGTLGSGIREKTIDVIYGGCFAEDCGCGGSRGCAGRPVVVARCSSGARWTHRTSNE